MKMDGVRNEEDLVRQQRTRPREDHAAAHDHNHHQTPPPLRCPRCDSSNTKFCYYNNYSLSQPRYFCKACRRYWTQGGTLRTVPIGGGCRKAKRQRILSSSLSSSSSLSNSLIPRAQGLSTTGARSQNLFSGQPSRPAAPVVPPLGGSFNAAGSYFSILAAMQSLPAGGINQGGAVTGGGGGEGHFSSNMALPQGMTVTSLTSPTPAHQQFPPPTNLFPSRRFSSWPQSVLNAGATSSSTAATSGLWNNSGGAGGDQAVPSLFTPNQWSDCSPGFNQ